METTPTMEAQGSIASIRFRNDQNGYSVIKLHDESANRYFMAVGIIAQEIFIGQHLKISGKIQQSKYGEQLAISKAEILDPISPQSIISFISEILPGIGAQKAAKIFEKFGNKTFQILDENIFDLERVPGISRGMITELDLAWKEHREQAQQYTELYAIGLTSSQAKKAIKEWGNGAATIIKANPYILMKLPGIGFLYADTVAMKQEGYHAEHPNRLKAGIQQTLMQAEQAGDCFLYRQDLSQESAKLLKVSVGATEQAISRMLIDENSLIVEVSGERIYQKKTRNAESKCSEILLRLAEQPKKKSRIASSDLADWLKEDQKLAIIEAFTSQLTVITGLPGTGKTTLVKEIINHALKNEMTIGLCAPTGKASKRLEQATGYPASTIHRLLNFNPAFGFEFNEENPLPFDMIIIDEASMVDVFLLKTLLESCPFNAHLVFVGDDNQLPSVGPGQVLRDIIQSKICHVTFLREIQRQALDSGIIRFSHAIHEGEVEAVINTDMTDVKIFMMDSPEEIRERLFLAIKELSGDVQVLIPRKTKCELSSNELNPALAPIMNSKFSQDQKIGKLRVGDKVIQTCNNYEIGIFNGEIGVVHEIDKAEKILTVQYDSGYTLYKPGMIDELDLAYALTIHKSQGSEYDTVILILSNQHFIMLNRELLYTAVTRAKKKLIIISQKAALSRAIKNTETKKRKTGLLK